jgi:two-component system chemotaxis response regulator CheB
MVQDPSDALHPSMPRAALDSVEVDHVLPVAEMGPVLDRIVREPVPDEPADEDPGFTPEDPIIGLAVAEDVSPTPAGYGCPACGGALYEIHATGTPRFRCRVGHAWSAETLLDEQAAALEGSLWMALRALEERGSLSRRMADSPAASRAHRRSRYGDVAASVDESAATVRKLIEAITAATDVDGGHAAS